VNKEKQMRLGVEAKVYDLKHEAADIRAWATHEVPAQYR
jgi:hypothetical protein